MRWGERRTAAFKPTRTDNLRPEAVPLVGTVLEWEFSGTIDEGPYSGQAIWMPVDNTIHTGWIPDEDLGDVP